MLRARFDGRPLARALETNGLVLLGEPRARGGVWRATFESDLVRPTPERAVERLLAAVEGLDEDAIASWRRCRLREFDFGYEGDGRAVECALSAATTARIAASGAGIRVTVYAPPEAKSSQTPADLPVRTDHLR